MYKLHYSYTQYLLVTSINHSLKLVIINQLSLTLCSLPNSPQLQIYWNYSILFFFSSSPFIHYQIIETRLRLIRKVSNGAIRSTTDFIAKGLMPSIPEAVLLSPLSSLWVGHMPILQLSGIVFLPYMGKKSPFPPPSILNKS